MKWSKILILFVVLSALVSCRSQYDHRMVRVKTQPKSHTQVVKRTERKQVQEAPSIENNEISSGDMSTAEPQIMAHSAPEQQVLPAISKKKKISHFKARIYKNISEPKDSIASQEPSVEFVKQQYRKANNYSIIALVLFLITPFTVISLAGAIVLAVLAIRIYRKYKNPGVKERYVMAVTVLALSLLAILLSAGLLYVIFIGL